MQSHKYIERRKHPRKFCALTVYGLASNFVFKAVAKNISLGGVFIVTPRDFATNEEIVLGFAIPDHEKPLRVIGKVAWNISSGAGVAFKDTPERLATMIESLS